MSFTADISDIVTENRNGLLGVRQGWERISLKHIATILNGFPFESSRFSKSSGTPLIRIRDIVPGRTETFFEGEYDRAFLVERGDLLVGMDGDFNSAIWSGEPALLNQRVCKITPDESRYSKRFLSYVLPGYLAAINAHTPSVTVKHLSSRTVAEIPLPLPPLPEQRRIVAEIEKQFTRLGAGVTALKRVQANLKRYRAAVLKAACEGRLVPTESASLKAEGRMLKSEDTGAGLLARILTERRQNWNGRGKYKEPATPDVTSLSQLPDGWAWTTVLQLNLANRPCAYGVLQPGEDIPDGVPFVRVGDISNGQVDLKDMKRISERIAAQYPRTRLHGGELAITLVGAIGRTAIIPESLAGGNTARAVGVIPLTKQINAHWIEIWFRNPAKTMEMDSKSHEVARKTLNLEDVRAASVAVPPLAEQTRIVAEVERRLSVIDELETFVATNLARATRLRQAVLQQAFGGAT